MTLTHTCAALALAAAAALPAGRLRADEPAATLADVRVFAVYEPVFSRRDVELLGRVHPDFVCRGWFKWHHTPDWQAYAPLAQACRDRGILLQGGITLAALYPGENGMDDAAFRDFACLGTDRQPFPCRQFDAGGWYHLSLYNPKVIDYLKRQARLQLDAGAAGIWYDEVEGYYDWNPTEGYDPYACAAFRDWLIRTYCDGQGWRDDDPRWRSLFGIDLSRHGGSIRAFDYLLHLHTTPGKDGRPLADDPPQGPPRAWATSPNPLYRQWGFAWDRAAAGTFRFDSVAAIFADLLADASRHALEKHGRPPLSTYNHNGTARPGVAFLQPHHGAQPPLLKGRLDARASYLPFYEDLIADAAEVCPGQPVVFFVDWPGETDRLAALPRADQTHFLSLYIPEAYAAGGEFALPLRGYSYVAADQGTLAPLARLADFYRAHAPWLRGSRPAPAQPAPQDRLTLRARVSPAGTALHIVNHAFSPADVWPLARTNLVVTLPWAAPAPAAALAVSPDFPEQRPVPLALEGGLLTLAVGHVARSAIVLLPDPAALRPLSGRAADGTHILQPQGRALAIARDGRFTLWLPPGAAELECLETGERLPARDGAAFAPPPPGGFASGLLLDAFGIPARHAPLWNGARRWHTDAWGRFRLPLQERVSVCVEGGATNALPLGAAFTAWRFPADSAPIDGFWANWPDKPRAPGVITLTPERHLGRDALACRFAPSPRVPWCNVNSPPLSLADAAAVEIEYAGDGSPRNVFAGLHAAQRFFRAPLPLAPTGRTLARIPLARFLDERGAPPDAAALAAPAALQFSPGPLGDAPSTFWLASARLACDAPVKELWQSCDPFDDADVDHLSAGHRPQPPPPAVAARTPLVGPAPDPARLLANWEGKGAPDAKPMVLITRPAPPGEPPHLRVTFPPGACGWGNANIPLPAAALRGQDGLALRLRATPSAPPLALTLHAISGGRQTFYRLDCEIGPAWTDLVLPWSEFRRDDGQPFRPGPDAAVNLQVCRPAPALAAETALDIGPIDAFTARP